MTTATKLTVDEYLASTTEGDFTQLIDGAIVVNEPTHRHGHAQGQLIRALLNWIDGGAGRGAAGPGVNVEISEHDLYGPNVNWYSEERKPDPDANTHPVPNIAAEVRSPSTWRYDLGIKKSRYEEQGLPELWLVDTIARTVLVYRRSEPGTDFDVELELTESDELTSPQLPGFALPVAKLFLPGD